MSFESQIKRVNADNERLIRQKIHDSIVAGGGDPTTPRSLHAIDNYRPSWEGRSELREVFRLEAIGAWSENRFKNRIHRWLEGKRGR